MLELILHNLHFMNLFSFRNSHSESRISTFVSRWVIYLLFFFIPLFFLPFTISIFEQGKQFLFLILLVVGFIVWLGDMVFKKRMVFSIGWIHLIPGLFLLSVLVSSIFSHAKYQTWVGIQGQEYTSFLTLCGFVIFYYFLSNCAEEAKIQKNSLYTLLVSAFLVGLIGILGVLNIFHLPFSFAQTQGFNTIGNINSFTSFLSIVSFVGLAIWLVSNNSNSALLSRGISGLFFRMTIFLLVVMNVTMLLFIDYWVLWILNIIGVLLLATFGFVQSEEFPSVRRFFFPLCLLLISLVFLFLPTPFKNPFPLVVSPSFSTSWNITKSTLGSDVKSFFLGSGPGTFGIDFLRFKPVAVNATNFWSIKLDRAISAFLTQLTTLGLLATFFWFVFMFWIGIKTIRRLLKERHREDWKLLYVMFVGWTMVLLVHFFTTTNMTMSFLLWGFSGILAANILTHVWKTDFDNTPSVGLISSFVFILIFVGSVVTVCLVGQKLIGEVYFSRAIESNKSKTESAKVISTLLSAITWNPYNDLYHRNISAAYLSMAKEKISDVQNGKLTPEQTKTISGFVSSSIRSARLATQLEPSSVINWSLLGSIYRDVMPFAQDAEDFAVESYMNAVRLDPTNPVYQTNLGQIYLLVADRAHSLKSSKDSTIVKTATDQEQTLLKNAEQILLSAIKTKGDYLPAHYYLSAVYERSGRLKEATERLYALTKNAQTDIGLGFQLSQILIRQKNYSAAKTELERLVKINPDYANALWYLASLYEQENDKTKAIESIKKILVLNPDNQMVKDRLKKMESGEITNGFPTPIPDETDQVVEGNNGMKQ